MKNLVKWYRRSPPFHYRTHPLYHSLITRYLWVYCLRSPNRYFCENVCLQKAYDSNNFQVSIQGEWVPWQSKVPNIEVETHKVAAPDVVIPTVDTVRHEVLLYTWLAEHKPLVLCGPPGSGKTMTLFCSLRCLPDMEVC